jgi:hypothetical protein
VIQTSKLKARLNRRPAIIESIVILDVLAQFDCKPDVLIYVDGDGSDFLEDRFNKYLERTNAREKADFRIAGY